MKNDKSKPSKSIDTSVKSQLPMGESDKVFSQDSTGVPIMPVSASSITKRRRQAHTAPELVKIPNASQVSRATKVARIPRSSGTDSNTSTPYNHIIEFMSVTNYDRFKKIQGNREVDEAHVRRIMREIKKVGNITAVIAYFEGQKLATIDGQHRVEACKRLKIPVQVNVISEPLSASQIAVMNAVPRRWNTYDYLTSKANVDNDAAASFLLSEMDKFKAELGIKMSPLSIWALMTGTESLTTLLKKPKPLPMTQHAFKTYETLRTRFMQVLNAVDNATRTTFQQAAIAQSWHDFLLDEQMDTASFVDLLKKGLRPALMNGARRKKENLKVIALFYCNNTGKSEQFKQEMFQRLGLV